MVGQKRTRTLADAKNDMKRQRPSVISYGPLLKGTPVRVIQKVQKVIEATIVLVIILDVGDIAIGHQQHNTPEYNVGN